MEAYLLISEAAREVEVESHVLRYWEGELKLPIKRNEQGHRYYTREDVEFFKQIKSMKEKGLQLKAIKMILKNGELDVLKDKTGTNGTSAKMEEKEEEGQQREQGQQRKQRQPEEQEQPSEQEVQGEKINGDLAEVDQNEVSDITKEDKTKRLQWLLQQLIREAVRENNRELCREIQESVVKEMDYQFRNLEEREEQRDAAREQREEEHFRKLDELIRKKTQDKTRRFFRTGKEK